MDETLKQLLDIVEKYRIPLLFIIFVITFSFFIAIRPYEQDESHAILAGLEVIKGEVDPARPFYQYNYSNPFCFIVGGPFIPIIYALMYLIGGFYLVRIFVMVSVLGSIYLVHIILKRRGGNSFYTVLLIGFSSSTILLASNAFLDSCALLFFMATIYLYESGKFFKAGMLGGLAAISKFILFLPSSLFVIYLVLKRKGMKYVLGFLLLVIPFVIYYSLTLDLIINDFLLATKLVEPGFGDLLSFLYVIASALPVLSVIAIALLVRIRKQLKMKYLLLPLLSILLFHMLTLQFDSFRRHMPYIEFSAAIIVGLHYKKINLKLYILILAFMLISLHNAYDYASGYPSYNIIQSELADVDGRVLALNQFAYTLIRDLPLNVSALELSNYYYFDYNGDLVPGIEDYEQALQRGYFNYALISSYSPESFPRYVLIENLVREYYCPVYETNRYNGIDIYKRC